MPLPPLPAARHLKHRRPIDVQVFAREEHPFQIDRCHALRSDGPAVQAHHPRWFRPAS